MHAPDAQLSEVLQASKWQTQARVGWRSRALIQVNLGVQWGDPLGILAHGNTPTGGKPWVCMERALKAVCMEPALKASLESIYCNVMQKYPAAHLPPLHTVPAQSSLHL
jgi:hypothetical protein